MHAFAFLKDPSESAGRSLFAVAGDDAYVRRETLEALKKTLLGGEADDLAITRFTGDKVNLADVLDEVRTLPFLVKRRVVIVDDADPFVTVHRKGLETMAEGAPTPGALILSVKTWPSNTRLAKLFAKSGLAIECKAPGEAELPGWLIAMARELHAMKLPTEAAKLLVELVGPEVGLLASELEKLAVFAGDRKEIRREDVAKMVGAGRVETVWRVLDAATTGSGREALADLDKLLASGEHPVPILAAFTASLRKVHHAGQLRRARRDLKTAAKEAGVYSSDNLGKQHAHLGPGRVDALPALLLAADLDLKGSSSLSPETIMERLVVRLARKRED